ncbi:MAG TPA: helix-hairpin-helix domain-containing protein [Geobacteraceae bacterium]|nr:helix-hairpin-helix domain-containing protein [Geobacteraceae bacterium]
MKKELKELQRLKGVGEILSQRLVEAGYDTLPKVAAAGEDALRKIRGINPRFISSIVSQAGELAGEAEKGRTAKVEELKQHALSIKGQVQEIARAVQDRFREEASGKVGKRTEKEILKVISSLERVEGILETRVKKTGKGLVKAEKRLEGLAEAGLKGVGKGLKKARKSLKRVLSK